MFEFTWWRKGIVNELLNFSPGSTFPSKLFKNQKPILPIIPQVCSYFVSSNLSIEEVIENLSKPVDTSKSKLIDYFAEFDFSSYAILMNKADPVKIFAVAYHLNFNFLICILIKVYRMATVL
uniref:Uncharacterized protein n=1 Tax=Strongyloides venezuelensis TaxID=75913 RepID=A0A0K0FPX2_STRVS